MASPHPRQTLIPIFLLAQIGPLEETSLIVAPKRQFSPIAAEMATGGGTPDGSGRRSRPRRATYPSNNFG